MCTGHERVAAGGTATVHGSDWGYCPAGLADDEPGHRWAAIEPATIDDIRLGHVRLASGEAADPSEAKTSETAEAEA